eukprot:SAG11_NODE_1539_length_4722_cov_4.377028_4_plen_208_part_00
MTGVECLVPARTCRHQRCHIWGEVLVRTQTHQTLSAAPPGQGPFGETAATLSKELRAIGSSTRPPSPRLTRCVSAQPHTGTCRACGLFFSDGHAGVRRRRRAFGAGVHQHAALFLTDRRVQPRCAYRRDASALGGACDLSVCGCVVRRLAALPRISRGRKARRSRRTGLFGRCGLFLQVSPAWSSLACPEQQVVSFQNSKQNRKRAK